MRCGTIRCLLIAGALAGSCLADGESVTCADCHTRQSNELATSVHKAWVCQECHGGDTTYTVASDALPTLRTGVGGAPFDHGPNFRGKPTRSAVPTLCGECHADIERMNPFGLRTDQLARYWTSGHGKTLKSSGDERVAVCIDCHGAHNVLPATEPASLTHPLNVPDTCGACHANADLMAGFDLPVENVDEYRRSVHGRLLLESRDTGAPTCATCHGNHSAVPPGFADVGSVCGRCHPNSAAQFATSAHATLDDFRGCVQCHGGGEGRHDHLIERIAQQPARIITGYARLMATGSTATGAAAAAAIRPQPKAIIRNVMESCLECHDEPDEDEDLAAMFQMLDDVGLGEATYAETGWRLKKVGHGMLIVEDQQFLFEDAKTRLIEIAPLQHSLNTGKVREKIAQLTEVCDRVNSELDDLEAGLAFRFKLLIPIWIFAIAFATALYIKFKELKARYVKPLPKSAMHETE